MKHTIWLLLIGVVFCFAKCEKENPIDSNNNNIPGLPPATQTGANTLGFLLNGVPWTPAGPNNLSLDYDPGFNNGIVSLVAYRQIQNTDNSVFALGIIDSLKIMSIPISILIRTGSLAQASFTDKEFCARIHFDTSVSRSGILNVTKLDRANGIFSGTFEIKLFNPNCGDTISITNGRFDLKF